jgi:two-component system, NtrC family, response regulator HydG
MPRVPVLITGPCGSGKCMAARHIHDVTNGAAAPFERLNCSEIADGNLTDMIGSRRRRGRKPAGDEDSATTIVLEDIERLSDLAQRQVVGMLSDTASGSIEGADPRLIATSTLSVLELRELPRFRKDLLYHLMTLPVAMPPLSGGPGNVVRLAEAILIRLSARYARTAPRLAADAVAFIAALPLKGNMLELEALMRGAILSSNESLLTASTFETVAREMGSLPPQPRAQQSAVMAALERSIEQGGFAIDDLNQQIYQMTIRRAGGNVAQAARMLGLTRAQFAYRLGPPDDARGG